MVYISYDISNKIIFENFFLSDKISFFERIFILVSISITLFIYFKFIPFFSYLILSPFSEDYIENNRLKISLLYLAFVAILNLGLKASDFEILKIPKAYKGEKRKPKDEIYFQIDRNAEYEENYR